MHVCCTQGRWGWKTSGIFFFFARVFGTLVVFLRLQHYLFNKPFHFDSNKCLQLPFETSKELIFFHLLLLFKDVFIFSPSYSFRKTGPLRDMEGPVLSSLCVWLQKCPLLPFPAQKEVIWMLSTDIWHTSLVKLCVCLLTQMTSNYQNVNVLISINRMTACCRCPPWWTSVLIQSFPLTNR